MNQPARIFLLGVSIATGFCKPLELEAQSAKDTAVLVSASVSELPPSITLIWPAATATGYSVSRKHLDDQSWSVLTNALPGTTTSFIDTNVTVGTTYEYSVNKSGSTAGYGYVYAGIKAPLIEERGKLILLVDSRFTSSLRVEIARLEQDLVGDGWSVIRHDVSSDDSPANIKTVIQMEIG